MPYYNIQGRAQCPGHNKEDTMNVNEDQIVALAIRIIESNLKEKGEIFSDPETTRKYLRLNLELLEHEVFFVMFFDSKHRLIESRELFRGTIDGASVHPREVVKEALNSNAAAVIFAHNHPSGSSEPSDADIRVTNRLKDALQLIDIRVLDHLVVGHGNITSFSERGWL